MPGANGLSEATKTPGSNLTGNHPTWRQQASTRAISSYQCVSASRSEVRFQTFGSLFHPVKCRYVGSPSGSTLPPRSGCPLLAAVAHAEPVDVCKSMVP
jgi:hypothetical protein